MPRVLKPVEHRQRRDTFLDAAQRLVQTKGYERMTVQDVLDDVGTSRGLFITTLTPSKPCSRP
jgi:AcrR family transcriptional regulator